jgi:hypothetical protein
VAEPVAPRDWLRIAELASVYRDFPLGTADASVVAAAERLKAEQIATSTAGTSASSGRPTSRLSSYCPDTYYCSAN